MRESATQRRAAADGPVVLVVDDDEAVRTVVRWQLEDDGFRTVEAEDGPTALRRIRDDRPALVVLDLSLPGLGGLDLLRALRGGGAGRSDTPVIVLSGERAVPTPRSSSCPAATARPTASSASTSAPTTTSSSRSRPASSLPGCGRCCGAAAPS